MWCAHWICPVHKRKSVHDPANYRGLQLTPQMSKAMERFLAPLFIPRLISLNAFGPAQFAYVPGRGARGAIVLFVVTWLAAFASGRRVALYCSDVSGAFDKVCSELVTAKLINAGVHQSCSSPPELVASQNSHCRCQ
eukprot:10710978-Alexandrium_andersonii.AAC.1